jgi:hypothetical protein
VGAASLLTFFVFPDYLYRAASDRATHQIEIDDLQDDLEVSEKTIYQLNREIADLKRTAADRAANF